MPDPPNHGDEQPDRENLAEIIDIRAKLIGQKEINQKRSSNKKVASINLNKLSQKETIEETRKIATRKLARKAMSSGELQKELENAGCPETEIMDVLADFKDSLYLDDLGLAKIVSEKLRNSKSASKKQIAVNLQKRLFEAQIIAAVLEDFDDEEETALLRETATKRAQKMRDLPYEVAQRRLLGFLARRGWSGDEVYPIVREVLQKNT